MNNKEIEQKLRQAIQKNKILHSYMFIGNKHTQKKEISEKLSKEILCSSKENKPCHKCKLCIEIEHQNHPDFKQIQLENNENAIKIEQIRNLQEDIIKKPIISERKIYLINNSDKMTIGAQNCLLKTLEEPPQYVTIILLVENENNILNTIKSRCAKINFTEESKVDMTEEQKNTYNELEKVFGNVENYSLLDVLNKLDILYKGEKNIFEILEYINTILYKNIYKNRLNINYIDYVENTKQKLQANANYNMCIDNLLLNIWNRHI